MIATIEKNGTVMKVSSLGAEPQSLVRDGIEYIWQGDKEYWFRRAPLLFPMIGPTKDNKIRCGGKEYDMLSHKASRLSLLLSVQIDDADALVVFVSHVEYLLLRVESQPDRVVEAGFFQQVSIDVPLRIFVQPFASSSGKGVHVCFGGHIANGMRVLVGKVVIVAVFFAFLGILFIVNEHPLHWIA